MTARALDHIGRVGGPRCCKRDSFLAVLAAVDFVRERLGVTMERSVPLCPYSSRNSQCIGGRCPFSAGRRVPRVAFLCVHNACRSQMAEALGRRLAGDVFDSFSAGTSPAGSIKPPGGSADETGLRRGYGAAPVQQAPQSAAGGGHCGHHGLQRPVTPLLPCSHREDWGLEDPSGREDSAFLAVMAQLEKQVLDLKRRIQAGSLGPD